MGPRQCLAVLGGEKDSSWPGGVFSTSHGSRQAAAASESAGAAALLHPRKGWKKDFPTFILHGTAILSSGWDVLVIIRTAKI